MVAAVSRSRRLPAVPSRHGAARLGSPGSPRCWFCCPLGKEWEARGGGREAAATRRDLGLRGDYREGRSCVSAVPGSPGPLCHGPAKRSHAKPLTSPSAPARPRRDCHPQSHRGPAAPQNRVWAHSTHGRDHVVLFACDSPSLSPLPLLFPHQTEINPPSSTVLTPRCVWWMRRLRV